MRRLDRVMVAVVTEDPDDSNDEQSRPGQQGRTGIEVIVTANHRDDDRDD